jgi:hypothetical protein
MSIFFLGPIPKKLKNVHLPLIDEERQNLSRKYIQVARLYIRFLSFFRIVLSGSDIAGVARKTATRPVGRHGGRQQGWRTTGTRRLLIKGKKPWTVPSEAFPKQEEWSPLAGQKRVKHHLFAVYQPSSFTFLWPRNEPLNYPA